MGDRPKVGSADAPKPRKNFELAIAGQPFKGEQGSHQPSPSHAHCATSADHHMVQHPHAYQLQSTHQFFGDRPVGDTRLGHSARMIVSQDGKRLTRQRA